MKRRYSGRLMAAAMVAALSGHSPAHAQEQTLSNDPGEFLKIPPKPSTIKGAFRLVSIGELLYSHPMADSSDAEFQKVVTLIRKGDVTIAIQEGPFLDLKAFHGVPGNGGLWGEPAKARDERAMGIDMVSLANNHSTDWGYEGLAETQRLLDAAGIVHSGAGIDLTAARKPGYLSSPRGRIALVSTSSTFRPYANATDRFGDAPARPGISTLRTRRVNLVRPEHFATIRRMAIEASRFSSAPPEADATEVELDDQLYRPATEPGVLWEMNLFDHAELLRSVREAKDTADFVVFTIHAHESPTGMDDDNPQPPAFLVDLFHDAVDAGADFILGGGQHAMRGIEIYKGKPILYGIGAFLLSGEIKLMQDRAYDVYPRLDGGPPPPKPTADATVTARPGGINPPKWYDGVAVVTDYDGARLRQMRLYPLDLGNSFDRRRRGIPHLASWKDAIRILRDIDSYSRPFGTRIAIRDGVGIIDMD